MAPGAIGSSIVAYSILSRCTLDIMDAAFTADSPGDLTAEALRLRLADRYARHPVEKTILTFRDLTVGEREREEGDCDLSFQSAESIYRAGAQRLPLSQVPKLPQSIVELTRLSSTDRAGRRELRREVESRGAALGEAGFVEKWQEQGKLGGAEHHVFYDEESGRWFKRLYDCVLGSTLGDYFDRMRLHGVLFPETAYRLEGFTINIKSKDLAPIVSQPHVEVDTTVPPVSGPEVEALMARMGFEPVRLMHNGVQDDGYYASYHPATGVLCHDLHDENVVRMARTGELAVIDPSISLARRGTWAALKLAEVGIDTPADDPVEN